MARQKKGGPFQRLPIINCDFLISTTLVNNTLVYILAPCPIICFAAVDPRTDGSGGAGGVVGKPCPAVGEVAVVQPYMQLRLCSSAQCLTVASRATNFGRIRPGIWTDLDLDLALRSGTSTIYW